jgi:hypothetical protein
MNRRLPWHRNVHHDMWRSQVWRPVLGVAFCAAVYLALYPIPWADHWLSLSPMLATLPNYRAGRHRGHSTFSGPLGAAGPDVTGAGAAPGGQAAGVRPPVRTPAAT